MADKLFKIDEAISVEFQATTGSISATLNVYDETGTLDEVKSGAMNQVGSTNLWRKSFTPDTVGIWFVQATDSKGGKAVKSYSVGEYNIETIGGNVGTVETKVDAVDSQAVATDTKVVAVDSQLTVTHTKVLAVDSQLIITKTKVDAVDSQATATDVKVVAVDSQLNVTHTKVLAIDSQLDTVATSQAVIAVKSQIAVIGGKVDALQAPPLIG